MKALKIIRCSDPLMWYSDKVGETVQLVREYEDCFMSREPAGYLNIVRLNDAQVIEISDGIGSEDPVA
jgi:hypothetical protein